MGEGPYGSSAIDRAGRRDQGCRGAVLGTAWQQVPLERTIMHQSIQVRMGQGEATVGAGEVGQG